MSWVPSWSARVFAIPLRVRLSALVLASMLPAPLAHAESAIDRCHDPVIWLGDRGFPANLPGVFIDPGSGLSPPFEEREGAEPPPALSYAIGDGELQPFTRSGERFFRYQRFEEPPAAGDRLRIRVLRGCVDTGMANRPRDRRAAREARFDELDYVVGPAIPIPTSLGRIERITVTSGVEQITGYGSGRDEAFGDVASLELDLADAALPYAALFRLGIEVDGEQIDEQEPRAGLSHFHRCDGSDESPGEVHRLAVVAALPGMETPLRTEAVDVSFCARRRATSDDASNGFAIVLGGGAVLLLAVFAVLAIGRRRLPDA